MQGDINEIMAFRFLTVDFHMLNWKIQFEFNLYLLLPTNVLLHVFA